MTLRTRHIASLVPAAALLLTALALPGCDAAAPNRDDSLLDGAPATSSVDWTATASLGAADSCATAIHDLRDMARTQMLMEMENVRRQLMNSDGYWYDAPMASGMAEGDGAATSADAGAQNVAGGAASNDAAATTGPSDYSQTNVQVEGVDEADIVKTDGQFIYTLSGADLVILDAWPAQDMAEAGRIAVRGTPQSFFLHGDQVVVMSYADWYSLGGDYPEDMYSGDAYYYEPYYWQPLTLVTVIDIKNPASPTVVSERAFDGYQNGARRIGDKVFLVQMGYNYLPGISYWPNIDWSASADAKLAALNELITKNNAIIDQLELADFLPTHYDLVDGGSIEDAEAQLLTDCGAVYTPSVFSGLGVLTLVTIDLDSEAAPRGTSVMGNWGTIYASLDNLYVAATNWNYYWYWETADDAPSLTTHIHKFDVGGPTARYEASGRVPGYVLNQFSMDEQGEALRVATTESNWFWWADESSESHVTVLAQDDNRLQKVGQVSGLGKGEQIYSVRFVGDRGYVVTYRQVDPLYVIDMSDRTAPTVRGELKIPGFSSYIHPIDADHLLTIGRDGTDEGQVLGLQFQIFDVSDAANPTVAAKTTLGDDWSVWSEASYDHHAFNYFPSQGLLALPVDRYVYDQNDWYGTYTSSLELFEVDLETGVTPAGSITHDDMLDEFVGDGCADYYGWSYRTRVRRGVFMDEFVYSISDVGVRVHDTTALAEGALAEVLTHTDAQNANGQWDECDYGWEDDEQEWQDDEPGTNEFEGDDEWEDEGTDGEFTEPEPTDGE